MAENRREKRIARRCAGSILCPVGAGCLFVACSSISPPPASPEPPAPAVMDPNHAYKLIAASIGFQGKARLLPPPIPEPMVAFQGIIKETTFENPSAILNEGDVVALLLGAGFAPSDVPTMVCTAKYESRFNPTAIGKNLSKDGILLSRDLGLWQINDVNWKLCGIRAEQELFDPKINARCAKKVFDYQGIGAWVAYKKNEAICKSYVLASR